MNPGLIILKRRSLFGRLARVPWVVWQTWKTMHRTALPMRLRVVKDCAWLLIKGGKLK